MEKNSRKSGKENKVVIIRGKGERRNSEGRKKERGREGGERGKKTLMHRMTMLKL